MEKENSKEIEQLLTRGTQDIFVLEHLKEALSSGKQLRVKLGIDPTGPAIHLGRAVALRKLKEFQDLGHQVVLIIGDFTARIGDPSDKLEKRPMLTQEQIQKNLQGYLEQVGKIIDLSKTEVRYNSEWLEPLSIPELGQLMECFTVQQMVKRRNFKERIDIGEDVFMVEFLYPAFQGYDSVAVRADVEIGGFDQLFNLKAGRTVQKKYGQEPQDIITVTMLEGTDGRKMSSSWGNVISILDGENEMFKKVMEVSDNLIIKYFTLCTDISTDEVFKIEADLKSGVNPRDVKMRLAHEIVKLYHGEAKADKAEQNFIDTFQKGEIPEEMEEIKAEKGEFLSEVLVKNKILESKSEWRRLVEGGGVHDLEKKETVEDTNMKIDESLTLKIGKKRFLKIIVN